MKKLFLATVLTITIVFWGTGCSVDSGTPPVLSVDGIDITIGQSTPYALTSQGFETSFGGKYFAIGEMPAKSWLSMPMSVSKDNRRYAELYLYNPNRESKLYDLCTINEVNFHIYYEDPKYQAEDNILVNGVNFYGMDSASVKEQMSEYKQPRETSYNSLVYTDGIYHYIFTFDKEDGILTEIDVKMDIAKSYEKAK